MVITREALIDKINAKDHGWFERLYYGDTDEDMRGEYEIVYDENWGDGNDYIIAFEFTKLKLFVVLEGTYSSWDSNYWDNVSFAEPYEYKETRYKPVTLDYIRNLNIETVLKDKPEDQ